MTKRTVLLPAAAAVALLLAGLLIVSLRGGRRAPAPGAPPPSPITTRVPEGRPAPGPARYVPGEEPQAQATVPALPLPEPKKVPRDTLRIRRDQILATVNGVAILGKDLAPFPPAEMARELPMSPEMFQARLARAIERELTYQEAANRSVQVSAEDLARLEGRLPGPDEGKYLLGDKAAVREHDLRDARAFLLEKALLASETGFQPHVSASDVEAYYQAHTAEFGPLPEDEAERQAAWSKLDLLIRQKLAEVRQGDYAAARRTFFDQLKARARIETYLSVE